MATMYDAVNVSAIPADATLVAGYVDGHYQTVPQLRSRFPHATVVTITVTGQPAARVCDCETGDLTPQQAAAWARAEIAAGRRPTIYCNTSTWPTVKQLMGAQVSAVDWWVAQYDGNPTIPAGAAAKQYSTGAYDTSATVNGWPTPAPVTAAAAPAPAPTVQEIDMATATTLTAQFHVDSNGCGYADVPQPAGSVVLGCPWVDVADPPEAGRYDRAAATLCVGAQIPAGHLRIQVTGGNPGQLYGVAVVVAA